MRRPEATQVPWIPKHELSSPTNGYGFGLSAESGNRAIGHAGGVLGISAQFLMHLESQRARLRAVRRCGR